MPALGRLDWLPAVEHPDLLAAPVAAAIGRGAALDCYVAAIDPALADTAAFCAAYAVSLGVSANCVVVTGRRGGAALTAACLVLASDRADVNRTVRKHLGVRRISFASMEEAVARTGMEYGGITPVGLPEAWPLLVDEAAAAADWIVVGSGIRASKLAMPGATAAALPSARVLALAQPAPA